ncbi:MAG: hypothetical protein HOI47_25180 [Candidatus Scalindua sp.]|nr:hypothetical protein [Gammaproteobacteria bacterium]MBT6229949.1 hypothetical protein [Candidatus Scalindua sp.]
MSKSKQDIYKKSTGIQDEAQAIRLLWMTRIFFATMLFLTLLGKGLTAATEEALVTLGFFVVFIEALILPFFIVHCVRLNRISRISRAQLIWIVLLSPISWIWFYPALTEPFKIYLGNKEAPEELPKESAKPFTDKKKERWHLVKVFLVSAGIIYGLIGILIYIGFSEIETEYQDDVTQTVENLGVERTEYRDQAGIFTADFLGAPTRTKEEIGTDGTMTSFGYEAAGYYESVNLIDYVDDRIYEGSPDYDFDLGFTAMLDGQMDAGSGNTQLISSDSILIFGTPGLRFRYYDDDFYYSGLLAFSGQYLINAFVIYDREYPDLKNVGDEFIMSIEF